MNTGVTASRYAKAFLSFVTETGAGEKVYSQVGTIVQALDAVPQLKNLILKEQLKLLKVSLPVQTNQESRLSGVKLHHFQELSKTLI